MSLPIIKPEHSRWTDDQWAAIAVRGCNLLVAAAAGSGKTAVLVERIIRLISDEQNQMNVDDLLVATFTNAAAAEMRDRIREALEKQLLVRPDDDHLRLQLTLLQRAQITTLHSFCLEVIRRYVHLIHVDPGFRIATEMEAQMIRAEVLDELFELMYASGGEENRFWKLSDRFGSDRSDFEFQRIVQQLYDQSRSHPWPHEWLTTMAERFAVKSEEGMNHEALNVWLNSLAAGVRLELGGAAGLLRQALIIAEQPAGPAPYIDQLHNDLYFVNQLLGAAESSWNELYALFQAGQFDRLKACRGDQYDKELQEQVKSLRNQAKEQVENLREQLFTRTIEQYAAELAELSPLMNELVELVIQFGEAYGKAKADKGLLDFSDLEHYCLQILRHEESRPDKLIPSPAAIQFREQFAEVLLDEYQDTNQVQETIVALIAKEKPGNRFMVGDVKQSIYRFRLAEPGLFMEKYRSYPSYHSDDANMTNFCKIDLSRNFRSRKEVVDGVNFIFRQLMEGEAGEIHYDHKAELVLGATYPPMEAEAVNPYLIEFALLERSPEAHRNDMPEGDWDGTDFESVIEGKSTSDMENELRELETVQLEARYIAAQIRQIMGTNDGQAQSLQVYDSKQMRMRPVTYRDIVILLRSTRQWAPVMIEELQMQGIPAYAELGTGYFDAIEIEVMLALLNIIDNPYQDISLAAVLRSPVVGLTADQLAQIRIYSPNNTFFGSVLDYIQAGAGQVNEDLQSTLSFFARKLEQWRMEAHQGALSDLIWKLFSETGYYDFAGGLPGGQQRQANLRALYDRAKQFEATSFRGLFRFLRFVERMKDSGGDLGTARALGEQEDVVRIMTIHKSKGLEFPVVFLAGIAKQFNRQDLNGHFLYHKELGFGPKYIDPERRISYPTLPSLAIRRELSMEMIAEEMRVLYVALTRAREKLFIIGTVKNAEQALIRWARNMELDGWNLPAYELSQAKSYLDWLGPAVMRHDDASLLHERAGVSYRHAACMMNESSRWNIYIASSSDWLSQAAAAKADEWEDFARTSALAEQRPLADQGSQYMQQVDDRLSWNDPLAGMRNRFAKTSITEMKRLMDRIAASEAFGDDYMPVTLNEQILMYLLRPKTEDRVPLAEADYSSLLRRPRFMEQRKLTAAERGSVFHSVMQHIPLDNEIAEKTVVDTVQMMLDKQLLTADQAEIVNPQIIHAFFQHEVGQRLLRSQRKYREIPFSFGLTAAEVYGDQSDAALDQTVLVQGVIDCLFAEDDGFILLDYKTDAVHGNSMSQLRQRYEMQVNMYARAVEHIWQTKVKGKYLYFFDGGFMIEM